MHHYAARRIKSVKFGKFARKSKCGSSLGNDLNAIMNSEQHKMASILQRVRIVNYQNTSIKKTGLFEVPCNNAFQNALLHAKLHYTLDYSLPNFCGNL